MPCDPFRTAGSSFPDGVGCFFGRGHIWLCGPLLCNYSIECSQRSLGLELDSFLRGGPFDRIFYNSESFAGVKQEGEAWLYFVGGLGKSELEWGKDTVGCRREHEVHMDAFEVHSQDFVENIVVVETNNRCCMGVVGVVYRFYM